jgi:hypothetical protein
MFDIKVDKTKQDYEIEMRSIKIGSKFDYEVEFPPNCVIMVNGKKVQTFYTDPLVSGRRKDLPFSLTQFLDKKL